MTRAATVTLSLTLLLATATACSNSHRNSDSTATARSTVPLDNIAGIASEDLAIGTTYTLQAGEVCTSGGRVTITSITPDQTIGTTVITDWGTRLEGTGISNPAGERVPLKSLGAFTHRSFEEQCPSARRQLDIEMHATTPVAQVTGFTVHYNAGKTFTVPVYYEMCSPAVTKAEKCPPPPDSGS